MRHYGHWKADQAARRYTDPLPGYRARASGQAAAGANTGGTRQGARTGTCWVGAGQGTQAGTRWVIPVVPLNPPANPSKESPPRTRGVRVGEIVAWRCWWLDASLGRLHSLFVPKLWEPGVPVLGDPDRLMPEDGSRKLGVYTVKADDCYLQVVIMRLIESRKNTWGIRPAGRRDAIAVGTVRLYGRVDEHENGYRAEAAMVETIDRIVECAASVWDPALITRLRDAYCPVEPALPGIDAAQWTGRS